MPRRQSLLRVGSSDNMAVVCRQVCHTTQNLTCDCCLVSRNPFANTRAALNPVFEFFSIIYCVIPGVCSVRILCAACAWCIADNFCVFFVHCNSVVLGAVDV